MKKMILAAAALAAMTTAASAETYRLDVTAAEGVKFAPWANAESVDLYTLSINGSPAVAKNGILADTSVPGLVSDHTSWFIFEAEQGDTITLAAMQGNSIDNYGMIKFTLPSDVDVMKEQDVMGRVLVGEEVIMGDEGQEIVKKIYEEQAVGTEMVFDYTDHAERMISGEIAGFDAGADEGTEETTSVDAKGTWTVIQLGK